MNTVRSEMPPDLTKVSTPRCTKVLMQKSWKNDMRDLAQQLELELGLARSLLAQREEENKRLRNGFNNLRRELESSPGLPLETCKQQDLERWTHFLTGLLMALSVLEATGKPLTMWEALTSAAEAADRAREGK